MTKAERLIFLSNLIANRGPVFVDELARECKVSHRTIYRDIGSLSRMNFPVYYENGYRMLRDNNPVEATLSHEDVDLICFALRNNPLSEFQFFQGKFSFIEEFLQARLQRKSPNHEQIFQYGRSAAARPETHEDKLCALFVKAVYERRMIRVHQVNAGGSTSEQKLIPGRVQFRTDGVHFLVHLADAGAWHELASNEIKSIEPLDDRFGERSRNRVKNRLVKRIEK